MVIGGASVVIDAGSTFAVVVRFHPMSKIVLLSFGSIVELDILLALIYDIGYRLVTATVDEEDSKLVIISVEVSFGMLDVSLLLDEVVVIEVPLLLREVVEVVASVPSPNVKVVGLATVVIDSKPPWTAAF